MGLKQPSPLGHKKRGGVLEQSVEEKKERELETLHIRFGVGVGVAPVRHDTWWNTGEEGGCAGADRMRRCKR